MRDLRSNLVDSLIAYLTISTIIYIGHCYMKCLDHPSFVKLWSFCIQILIMLSKFMCCGGDNLSAILVCACEMQDVFFWVFLGLDQMFVQQFLSALLAYILVKSYGGKVFQKTSFSYFCLTYKSRFCLQNLLIVLILDRDYFINLEIFWLDFDLFLRSVLYDGFG